MEKKIDAMIGFIVGTAIAIFAGFFADKIEPLIYNNLPIGANTLEIFFIYIFPIIFGIVLLLIIFKIDKRESLKKKILDSAIVLIFMAIGFIAAFYSIGLFIFRINIWFFTIQVALSLIFLIILIIRNVKHKK